ncbi:MAG: hypothetical protein K0S65_1049 [Labilithrix sp.]|nr:hypothetical protein [Labilithrix sp.]
MAGTARPSTADDTEELLVGLGRYDAAFRERARDAGSGVPVALRRRGAGIGRAEIDAGAMDGSGFADVPAYALRRADDAGAIVTALPALAMRAVGATDTHAGRLDARRRGARRIASLALRAGRGVRALARGRASAVDARRAFGTYDPGAGIDAAGATAALSPRAHHVRATARDATLLIVAGEARRAAERCAVNRDAEARTGIGAAAEVRIRRAAEVVERDALGNADALDTSRARSARLRAFPVAVEVARRATGLRRTGEDARVAVVAVAR